MTCLRMGDAVTTRSRAGDVVTTRLRSTLCGRCNHDSLEANLRRETQSRLTQGQTQEGDTIMTRHESPEGEIHSHDSSRLTQGWETSHDSPMANPGQEK